MPQNEVIYGYGVAICAQRVIHAKLIHAYVGTKMCAHRSITEYEDTHTTEGTQIATLYQHISTFRPITAKEKTLKSGLFWSSARKGTQ